MPAANLPVNELDRLRNLYSYELLDTLPEKDYDDITKLASYICNTPVSLVTLVDKDRQWIKSAHGTDLRETPREIAFCAHAILKPDEMMIVPNAEKDERFAGNPLVTGDHHVLFYAGVPLLTEEGFPIGSLCVLDNKPKELNENQQQSLTILANQTMRLIQLHKKTKELSHSQRLLEQINKELESFAQVTAENLKSPCDNAIEFADMIAEKFDASLDGDGKQLLSLIKYSCESIKNTVDTTLERTERINSLQEDKTLFTFSSLMQDLKQQAPSASANILLHKQPADDNIYFYKSLLLQMLDCIVLASSGFNSKENLQIQIAYKPNKEKYIFTVTDNGDGIPAFSRHGEYLLLKETGEAKDNHYTANLNKVKKLTAMLSGSLEMSFEEGKGTQFIIHIPK